MNDDYLAIMSDDLPMRRAQAMADALAHYFEDLNTDEPGDEPGQAVFFDAALKVSAALAVIMRRLWKE